MYINKQEPINFYHSLLKFGVNPGLERINALLSRLGSPHIGGNFVHVAGTNGKGSVCAFLSNILKCAGYKTGLFISPYIMEFNERIQINGENIPDAKLAKITVEIKAAVENLNKKNIFPTEFEAVTAAAMLYFKRENCDVAVLETGLGGLFDSTNVIEEPLVSVITSISMDHAEILGGTNGLSPIINRESVIEKIAAQKCGIIKPGRPVVTNNSQDEKVLKIIKNTAMEKNSPLLVAATKGKQALKSTIEGSFYNLKTLHSPLSTLHLNIPFPGRHQLENAITAAQAVCELWKNGFDIKDSHIEAGIETAKNPARIQILQKSPLIILDGSHNEGSAAALAEAIRENLGGKRLLGLMGVMKDKDCDKMLENLLPLFSALITTRPDNPRALAAEELKAAASYYMPPENIIPVENPADAYSYALKALPGFDGFIICGSLYLAGDILRIEK